VWDLRYWDSGGTKSPIERWLNKLPEEQLIAITNELLLLADIGNELALPIVSLWERDFLSCENKNLG
jgi:hypothetical protein